LDGDCHPGNMLWTDVGSLFVGREDRAWARRFLDPWIMLSATGSERALQLTTPR